MSRLHASLPGLAGPHALLPGSAVDCARSAPDVLEFARIKNGYPTERPVELMAVLVRQSADRGSVVADPFCGSGSVGVAAVEHGAHFLGCDIVELAVAHTRRRLRAAGGVEVSQEIAPPAPGRARTARRWSAGTTRP